MKRAKGQSTLEFSVLFIIIVAAMITMSVYFKRSIQGRWKDSIDGLGDQYDPRLTNAHILETLATNAVVRVFSIPDSAGGVWTQREDMSNSITSKSGFINVGAGN